MANKKTNDGLGDADKDRPALSASALRSGPEDGTSATIAIAHTPGPWELFSTGEVWSSHGHIVKAYASSPADKANARLIAAAPDLLSALETMVKTFDGLSAIHNDAYRQARAALRNATNP